MKVLAATLAFVVELLMLVGLALAGFSLGGAGGVVAGVVAVVAVGLLWGRLLAPRAARRLALWPRIGLKAVLFAATAVAIAAGIDLFLGVVFAVAAVAALAGEPLLEGPPDARPAG